MNNILIKLAGVAYVHVGLVTILRTLQTQGSGEWHRNIFGKTGWLIFEWWWAIIPSIVIVVAFAFVPNQRIKKYAFWIFTGIVLFMIGGTYL